MGKMTRKKSNVVSGRLCNKEDCTTKHFAKGYCSKHYRQVRKFEDTGVTVQPQHGDHGSPEYITWTNMKARCTNPKNSSYKYYGSRGIKVCKRWMDSYTNFLEDMGRKPEPHYCLGRHHKTGDFEKENCLWLHVQDRTDHAHTVRGEDHPKAKLCDASVRGIKILLEEGELTQKQIADLNKVSQSVICSIGKGKTWKHVRIK